MAVQTRLRRGAYVAVAFAISYLIGSIPFAYIIVKAVTGEDVTAHGTGNVGSMNVRRTTGSWAWFVVAVLGDGLKGFIPTFAAKYWVVGGADQLAMAVRPWGMTLRDDQLGLVGQPGLLRADGGSCRCGARPQLLVLDGAYQAALHSNGQGTRHRCRSAARVRLALLRRSVVVVGLAVIAITRYMMAGQVAAAVALPVAALALDSPDWPFALAHGGVRLRGSPQAIRRHAAGARSRKLYVDDRMGPRG